MLVFDKENNGQDVTEMHLRGIPKKFLLIVHEEALLENNQTVILCHCNRVQSHASSSPCLELPSNRVHAIPSTSTASRRPEIA
jgi:hypothetical protein